MNSKATLVFSNNSKTVTVIGVNNSRSTIVAQNTLAFWARKDGGYTFHVDGEHSDLSVRVDRYGRLTTKNGQGKAVPLAKGVLRIA